MSTKDALALLETISSDKKILLDIAKSYVADKLNVYYSVVNCICLKEDDMVPFGELPEFAQLRKRIANIENATGIINDFFEIDDDIAKINYLLDEELLIAYMEVDDYDSDGVAESVTSAVSPVYNEPEVDKAADVVAPVELPKVEDIAVASVTEVETEEDEPVVEPAPVYPDEPVLGNFYAGDPVIEEPVTEAVEAADEQSSEESEQRIVGIYKEEYDTSWAPDYEPDEDEYFLKQSESEILGEDEKPKLSSLFNDDETKTEKDDILAEAEHVISQGNDFIFTGATPQIYLSKRFEYYRIKYALKNIEDGEDEETELDIIKNELIKLRGYDQHGVIMPVQAIQYDMMMVEKIYGLLKEFDDSLYPADSIPNIDELLSLMDVPGEYDEKANKLHQFFMVDTVNFLKNIYKNCSSRELDKNKRISVEMEKLDEKHFEDLRELEREFYAVKNTLKGKFGSGKNDYANKKKALEDSYNEKVAELESSIKEVIEQDTRMVGKNMKLYARIDKILRSNVLCFQAK